VLPESHAFGRGLKEFHIACTAATFQKRPRPAYESAKLVVSCAIRLVLDPLLQIVPDVRFDLGVQSLFTLVRKCTAKLLSNLAPDFGRHLGMSICAEPFSKLTTHLLIALIGPAIRYHPDR
jgi:hypothetical protein